MRIDDIPAVHRIECSLFPDPWPERSFRTEVMDRKISFPYVAEANDTIIGYIICWYYLKELHIGNIAVAKSDQGKGIGKFLLKKILESFHDYQIAYLEVRENNTVAINLYQSFGFIPTYRRRRYYPNGEDAIVMTKYGQNEEVKVNNGLV
jgi:ribosomal-protein-alanine N-acetyltransferase